MLPCLSKINSKIYQTDENRARTVQALRGRLTKAITSQDKAPFARHIPNEIKIELTVAHDLGVDWISSVEMIPFSYPDITYASISGRAYERLARKHRSSVNKIKAATGIRRHYIPPLLSVALSRSRTREDLLEQIGKLREEFSDFRASLNRVHDAIIAANNFGDQLGILDDFDQSLTLLEQRAERKRTRMVQSLLTLVGGGSLVGIATKAAHALFGEVEERLRIRKVSGFSDMWSVFTGVDDYFGQAERIFGTVAVGSQSEIANAVAVISNLTKPT